MQTPPEIEFQGMVATQAIEEAIAKHVAELEQRWDPHVKASDQNGSGLSCRSLAAKLT